MKRPTSLSLGSVITTMVVWLQERIPGTSHLQLQHCKYSHAHVPGAPGGINTTGSKIEMVDTAISLSWLDTWSVPSTLHKEVPTMGIPPASSGQLLVTVAAPTYSPVLTIAPSRHPGQTSVAGNLSPRRSEDEAEMSVHRKGARSLAV